MGIPGDMFMEEDLKDLPKIEKQRLSKEFVKFNERSTLRLLGDMRAYNYVIVPTYDFDQVQYRINPNIHRYQNHLHHPHQDQIFRF